MLYPDLTGGNLFRKFFAVEPSIPVIVRHLDPTLISRRRPVWLSLIAFFYTPRFFWPLLRLSLWPLSAFIRDSFGPGPAVVAMLCAAILELFATD